VPEENMQTTRMYGVRRGKQRKVSGVPEENMQITRVYGVRRGKQREGVSGARRKYAMIIYSMGLGHFVANRHTVYWGLIRWPHVDKEQVIYLKTSLILWFLLYRQNLQMGRGLENLAL